MKAAATCLSCGRPWITPGDRDPAAERIEALEKALREIANDPDYGGHRAQVYKLSAQHALDQSSPPSATE